jgi:hypothetical protein
MYRLIIDWPNGSQSQSRPGPVETRHELGLHAMQFIGEQVPSITIIEGKRLGAAVKKAGLGEPVKHEASGYTFTTKEF